MSIGCAAGLLVGLTPLDVPDVLMSPIELIGAVTMPLALLVFGMSLPGAPRPGSGETSPVVWLAVGLKTLGQPAVAYLFGAYALGLRGTPLLAVMITSGLPRAQMVLVYALRYSQGTTIAREATLLSTFISVPVLIGIAAIVR